MAETRIGNYKAELKVHTRCQQATTSLDTKADSELNGACEDTKLKCYSLVWVAYLTIYGFEASQR